MTHTTIARRRQRRLSFGSLWLPIGFGLILLLAGCGSGGSSNGTGGNGTGPGGNDTPSCDISVATDDCDEDGVLNGDDEFPQDASRSCTVTAENSAPGATADCDNDGTANNIDNCPAVASNDLTDSDTDNIGDICDTDDDNDGEPDESDVDDDNDGLIEIATAAELDNVRHNLEGTSYDDEEADTSPGDAGDTTGCPSGGCNGYELSDNINLSGFDSWQPIGPTDAEPFNANFDGNDFMVSNMVIDTSTGERIGLFGTVSKSNGAIRSLHIAGRIVYRGAANASIGGLIGSYNVSEGLVDGCSSAVDITGGSHMAQVIGGLVGRAIAPVQNSWATGAVHSCGGNTTDDEGSCEPTGCTCAGGGVVGGLVGSSNSTVFNSYATGDVRGNGAGGGVGGLVGASLFNIIVDAYATGAVVGGSGADTLGGLVGNLNGSNINNSYATGTVDDGDSTAGSDIIGELAGAVSGTISDSYFSGMIDGAVSSDSNARTAAQLQAPDSVGGIYSAWSARNWDFGSASQFPALKSYVDANGDGDNEDFGEEGVLLCGQPAPRAQCSS